MTGKKSAHSTRRPFSGKYAALAELRPAAQAAQAVLLARQLAQVAMILHHLVKDLLEQDSHEVGIDAVLFGLMAQPLQLFLL